MIFNVFRVAVLSICLQQVALVIFGPWTGCDLVCDASPAWFWSDMVLEGGTFLTIPSVEVTSVCEFLCAAIPDCQFWTQDTTENTCALKNLDTGNMKTVQKDYAYSGPKCRDQDTLTAEAIAHAISQGANPATATATVPATVADMYGYIAYGIDYRGADIRNYEVADEKACQDECIENGSDCSFWTFDVETKLCYQKQRYGWTILRKDVDISGASPV